MAFVPYDFEGEFPENFFEIILDEGEQNGESGWFVDYPDTDGNGYADFVDEYNGVDIVLRPSQNHAGT